VLFAGAANVCQARFSYLLTASVEPAKTPAPDAPRSADSPIASQRAVPLGGAGPDRQVLTRTLLASPDSAGVTYRLRYGAELQFDGFVVNDSKPFGVSKSTDPAFAPDSKSVAVVFLERGWKLYHQNKTLDGYEPVTPVRFSPDGQRLVYLARLEAQRFVVEGDTPHPRAERIDWDRLVFSPDSSVLAYPAYDGQHWRMVVNGDPGPAWERIATEPVTAQQGPGVFYVAVKGGRYFLADRHTSDPEGGDVFGAHSRGAGFRLIESPPVLSDDGSIFAYWAMSDDQRWRVYQNHQPVAGYEADRPGQLILSPDGQTLAAVLKRDGQWRVVLNGTPGTPGTPGSPGTPGIPGPAFTAIGKGSLTLSKDARSLAYAVRTRRGWAVVRHGQQPSTTYPQIIADSIRLGPDGQRLAYAALTQGQWSVIVEGPAAPTANKPLAASRSPHNTNTRQPHPPFNRIDASTLTFSPDGQRFAYIAYRIGRPSVVVDGQVVGEYDHAEQLTFSPQGDHLVWFARQDGQSFLVVDGTESTELFDQPVPGAHIRFTSDTACHTVAVRRPGPTFARIELKLSPIPAPATAPGTAPETDDTYGPDAAPGPPAPAEPPSPFVDVPTP
jgi:WD40-like Beta Propeller Repeat